MTRMERLPILYEDNHLLAVDKPAGLVTQGSRENEESAVVLAKEYLKRQYNKPGNVYLGVVSRLDAWVTGVLLFARTSKAAARLNDQFRLRQVRKVYWAFIEAGDLAPSGQLVHWLWHDDRNHRVVCVERDHPEGQEARLSYRVLEQRGSCWLLEIELLTGRKHQIRVQLAEIGYPIVGDQKYGSEASFPRGIALHSRRLEVEHPVQKSPVVIEAPPPPYWPSTPK